MKKVLLAMSGGVDSSVAAIILKNQGYDVTAAFMKNWSDTKNEFGECAWKDERDMAIRVCSKLNIPLITIDFEKEYRKLVIDEMYKKYQKGITPNPDIDCNQKIKFPLFIKEAKKRGINLIATGHYARIKKSKGRYQLIRAKDESKDQSYFLYRIKEKDLEKTLFPIGNFTKKEVRELAKKNKLPNYDKKSTVGICFVGKVNLKNFLKKKIKPKKGKILDPEGRIIGEHDGIYYYTIGQRIGPKFGIDLDKNKTDERGKMKKWYVAQKDLKKNIIIAAPENHPINFRKEFFVKELYLISSKKEDLSKKRLRFRIRQVGELLEGEFMGNKVVLKNPITGVSEGQAVVIYSGKTCLGGGVINFK